MLAKLANIINVETEKSNKVFLNYFMSINIAFLVTSLCFYLAGDKLYSIHIQIHLFMLILLLLPLKFISTKIDNPKLFKYMYFALYIFYIFTLVYINNKVDVFSLILLLSINAFGIIYLSQRLYLISTVIITLATMLFSYSHFLYEAQSSNVSIVSFYRSVIIAFISLGFYMGLTRITQLMGSLLSDTNSPFIDELTGAYNKYYLKQKLSNLPVGGDVQLSIVTMGVDAMKDINSTYGASAGDTVLQSIANIVKQTTRNTDSVCRNEGDKFAIIVQHPKEFLAENLAGRIKQLIGKDKIGIVDKNGRELKIEVTASYGVVTLKEGENSDTLLERGEKALELAKKNGKNRIEKGE